MAGIARVGERGEGRGGRVDFYLKKCFVQVGVKT